MKIYGAGKNNLIAVRQCAVGIVAALLLVSCLPEPLEVDNVPVAKPEIVVSSQIIPDQSLIVMLTRTIGALEASDDSDPQALIDQIAVNDAVVTIESADSTYVLLSLDNGVYGGAFIPFVTDETYTLHVKSESLGEVTATTTVKPRVTFASVQAELYPNGYGDTLTRVTYLLNDPALPNWYMINVQEVERNDVMENVINPRAQTRLVEDAEFNGQSFSEEFPILFRDYRRGDSIAVSLSNISEDYYKFMKLRQDNRFSFVEFLGEPLNYPSNVQGGKGFFNLYVPDVRFFILE